MNTSFPANKNVLVTGGAGFIGSHLVDFLLSDTDAVVTVLDNLATGNRENVSHHFDNSRFQFIEGDIRNYNDVEKAMHNQHIVFHLAALGSVPRSIEDPITSHAVNAIGFLNVLESAREAKIERLVFSSSSSIYGDIADEIKKEDRIGNSLSPYAVTKYENELHARIYWNLHGLKTIGLRYFNIFGPRQSPNGPYAAAIPLFISGLIHKTEVFINGDGEQSRDFTFVQNVVNANICAASCVDSGSFGEVFNIGCGDSISVNRMFSAIAKELGSNQKAKYREERIGDVRNSRAGINKAKSTFGYEPEVLFEEGIKRTVNWFKSR